MNLYTPLGLAPKGLRRLLFFDEHDDVVLSDNVLDVIPGDEQVVRVSGMTADCFPLGCMYLGM